MEQDDLSITPLFAVYGTLKYGCSNWRWVLSDSEYVGPNVTLDKYVLGDVGFPYLFKDTDNLVPEHLLKPVVVDVFKVSDDSVVGKLDRLEGVPHHYQRELIQLADGLTCWTYVNKELSDLCRCYKCDVTENDEWVWNPVSKGINYAHY
jgi:gamma-glutamylcyclotransferase (GGCT)/AIG2-like uncharacterized protein YtfP